MNEVDIQWHDLENSLAGRGGDHDYNEWVIRDFNILGLFAVPPFEVMTRGTPVDYSNHPDPELRSIGVFSPGLLVENTSEKDILTTFIGRRVWSFRNADIVSLDQAGVVVKHDTIYAE